MFCKNCGNQLEDNAVFCANCGTRVTEQGQTAQQTAYSYAQHAGQFIDGDVIDLIGENNQTYYINRFADMKQQNKKTTWNWAACLLSPAWFAYRKMYAYALIYFAIGFLLGDIVPALDLVLWILGGIFGNWIYMDWLEKQSLKAKQLAEPMKSQFINKNRGTSWGAVFAFFGLSFAISFLWVMIF